MSLEEALAGVDIPEKIKKTLVLIDVLYISFDGLIHKGQLVVHESIAGEIKEIFSKLLDREFPIKQAIPAAAYNWDDDASMAANNTSAFNYRLVHGTEELSNHSYGLAIDINPAQNPYVRRGGQVMPPGSSYDVSKPGTLTPEIVSLFKTHGWEWGGDWERKDWQHFQKSLLL